MQPVLILQLVFLLTVGNGTPVIAKKILGKRLSYSLDGGRRFLDGRPAFGASKTLRGILLSIVVTSMVALQNGVLIPCRNTCRPPILELVEPRHPYQASSHAH